MQELVSALDVKGGSDACEGIMTTDTFKKQFAVTFTLQDKVCHIGGCLLYTYTGCDHQTYTGQGNALFRFRNPPADRYAAF